MRPNRSIEIGTGFFVLLGFAALAFLSTQLPGSGLQVGGEADGYEVTARFGNVGDLKVGAPVSMAGVRLGRVTSVALDPTEYRAVVKMRIDKGFDRIPDTSWANIETAGLLGAKYVGLEAKYSETYLKDQSEIENTQEAMVLEKLIGQLFSSFADRSGNKGPDATAQERTQ